MLRFRPIGTIDYRLEGTINRCHSVRGECLPNHLHRKLNLPRSGGCRIQQTRGQPSGTSVPIKYLTVGCGRIEIGVIENVENFHSELDVKLFGDSFHVVVLEQRHVQVDEPGAHNAVAPNIAQQVGARAGDRRTAERDAQGRNIWSGKRQRETVQVKVVKSAMDGVAPVHDVRKAERVGAVHSERIGSDRDGKWHARAGLEYPAVFPTARGPAQDSRESFRTRNLPGVAKDYIVGLVEILRSASKPRIEEKHAGEAIAKLIPIG